MTATTRYAWLYDAVDAGAVIVTASRRLARELGVAFNARMLAGGRQSWRTPAIHAWQDWLGQTVDSAGSDALPQLIDSAAAALLWEQSLDRTSREDLLSIAGVVRHAQTAWERLHDWQVSPADLADAAHSRDEHWYVRAAAAYAARLHADRLADAAGLCGLCVEQAEQLQWPPYVIHAGFDRPVPALAALFERLRALGVRVEAAPRPDHAARTAYRSYADDAAQWRAAGAWARAVLDREPAARVAIVVSDLDADAARIGHRVREGFVPGWQQGQSAYRDSVNVSYGQRLAEFPAIDAALACLRFAAEGLRSADAAGLLQSPFIATAASGDGARADLLLRGLPERTWRPAELGALLEARRRGNEPACWQQPGQVLAGLAAEQDSRNGPAAWAEIFDRTLEALGWPGPRPLDSDEFQLQNRWRQLLNQLARLERVRPSMSLAEAVRRLVQLASDAIYQSETDAGVLDVMGLLEAAGLEFDYLWIGGMDASRWPAAGNPLALVNRSLQRAHGMPDATPADTLDFAQRTLQRLQRAAGVVMHSWARMDGDTELTPSPLLALEAATVEKDSGDPGWYARASLAAGQVHRVDIDRAPAVTRDETISGGSYTVQAVREEPFRAFVGGRLAAEALEPFAPGLTPRLRGTLVHDALHRLLEQRPSRDELRGWPDTAARCERAAYLALRDIERFADPVLQRVLRLEKQRLENLQRAFLELEGTREPFAIVGLEQKLDFAFGTVRLTLRLDRIDRLEDGRLLLIDYKTGNRKPFLDTEKRPKTVQLSVYACAVSEPVGAMAFFNIDSRGISYDGAGAGFKSGTKEISEDDWDDALAEWQDEVKQLLARFAAGDLGINVVQGADDARPLALLSRVEELRRER